MAAIPIYIIGTILTKAPKDGGAEVGSSGLEQCVIHGLASIEGLSIGGGPIIPPGQPPDSGNRPTFPISGPPGSGPGAGFPDKPGYPTIPGEPPQEPIAPPVSWKPIWTQDQGWVAVGVINPDLPHPTPSAQPPPQG